MKELSATEAARHFADVLDGVEFEGETFVIARHGRVVARIQPVGGNGASIKAALRANPVDAGWLQELQDLRGSLPTQERIWNS